MRAAQRTFSFFSRHLKCFDEAPGLDRGKLVRSRARAFTLIELMVVVVVISITAAIAMPGIVNRMRSNETKVAAENIAMYFRRARLRAVGRSSAVLVRYNAGVFEVHEGIQGNSATDAGCARVPESSCNLPTDRWANTNRSQLIDRGNYVATGQFALGVTDWGGANPTTFDVCFSPSGRAFYRVNPANPFTNWTGALRIDVDRIDEAGFQRSVLVTPTGAAKVVAAP